MLLSQSQPGSSVLQYIEYMISELVISEKQLISHVTILCTHVVKCQNNTQVIYVLAPCLTYMPDLGWILNIEKLLLQAIVNKHWYYSIEDTFFQMA